MNALLLVAFIFAAMNTAFHIGARDFSWGFWLNLVVMLVVFVVGFTAAREERG